MTLVKDLLRRRLPQVTAIYIGASWGLVEFVAFITQRFALSPHLIDLALVGPLLLLPSVILMTYFHGAPGQDEWVTAEKIGIPVNLVMAGLFLVLFFQGKDLGAATTTVVVTDEDGVEAERVVPKTEFRKRITVYFSMRNLPTRQRPGSSTDSQLPSKRICIRTSSSTSAFPSIFPTASEMPASRSW